jgi:hypothetical protein
MTQSAATMLQTPLTPAQKIEMVQAELEVAKLRLRQQTRERQGLGRVAPSRATVLQRLAPLRVRLCSIEMLRYGLTLASYRSSNKSLDLRSYACPVKHPSCVVPAWTSAE